MGFDRDLFVRRLLGHRDFWGAAIERREIYPPSMFERPAAIHEDDFGDITGLAPGVSREERIANMQAGQVELPATEAFRFRNLRISQGSIYSDTGHIQLRIHQPRTFGREKPEVISETVALACNRGSTGVWYHFAVDQMCRELLAQDLGHPAITLPSLKPFWHEDQLRDMLGLQARKVESALLEDAWVFIDRGKNASFTERFERIRAKTCRAKGKGDKLIYLRRGSKGAEKREIQNEAAFEAALASMGFETVEASNPNLDELAEAMSRARVTVTIEGSQAAHHFMYAPRGAAFLTLMPADRFNHILKEMCDILDMPFGFVLGHVTGSQEYDYSLDTLEKVLNRMEA